MIEPESEAASSTAAPMSFFGHPVVKAMATILALLAILAVGAHLRFTNLNWDDGKHIHPDETHMQSVLLKIHTPENWAVYFDTDRSPLNVRNAGDQYSYGTLPMFLVRFTAEGLDGACDSLAEKRMGKAEVVQEGAEPVGVAEEIYNLICVGDRFTGFRSKVLGRAFSGMFDLGTILLAFSIGRRLHGTLAGLLAAALTSLTAFLIQQAHFFTVDSALCFFVTLTAYYAVRASQTGGWGSFGLAGLSVGLAAACKVSGVYASLMVALAAVVWIASLSVDRRRWGLWNGLAGLALASFLCVIAFRVAQPYAFEGPGFFDVEPSEAWLARLDQIKNEQSGDLNSPPDQQWANRAPILFPWLNVVVWGMGLPLGLAAWAGWVWAGVEMWRGKRVRTHLILWAWTGLVFLYLGTRWVKSMRYFVYLYPLLIVFGAYALARLCRASRQWWRLAGISLTAAVLAGTALWGYAVFSIYLREHTRLIAGRWIFDNIPDGSVLAQEHWDWGPHIPGGKAYTIIEMQNYHEDTWDKREQMYAWLDQADYIVISSNRIYAVVPRLKGRYASDPEDYRYPMTSEYYRALFAGELGFELAADFTVAPAIGPFQFPDQEIPFPLMEPVDYLYQTEPIEVYLPPAEEAFSVYDHPRVLIFRKTAAYSRQLVESVLGRIEVERALRDVKPVDFTMAPELMEYDPDTWADQQAGGTWSDMFNRDSLLNRYPGLAVIVWWIAVALLGWLAFPLLYLALPRLRDRGYGLARVFALLLLAYLTWIAASLHVLPNTRDTILRVLGLLVLAGGGVGWFKRAELRRFVLRERRMILTVEGLFVGLYLVWIGIRLVQPDLWHVYMGGEKPMEFAYLNAVIKSTWFPPYNPWFAGGYMNYYYFGYVIVGTLTKLLGTVPAIAFNLVVPLLCALTGMGAFSVAYNLFGGHRRGALVAGVMAVVFAIVLGNLGVVHLVGETLIQLGGPPFESTIPGFPEAAAFLKGLWQVVVRGTPLGIGNTTWYWHPTRIIPQMTGNPPQDTGNPIVEFPAFTFLYADLHPHMIAFPLTLLAMALVVYWIQVRRPMWASLLIGGVVVGALRPTNTWDYYPYLILSVVVLAVRAWIAWRSRRDRGVALWQRTKRLTLQIGLLVGLTFVLYLPYIQHFGGYSSIQRWWGGRTPVSIYLWIHAILLFPVVTRVLIEVARLFKWRKGGRCGFTARRPSAVLGMWGGLLGLTLVLLGALWGAMMLWKQMDTHTPASLAEGVVPVSFVALPVAILAAVLLLAPASPVNRRLLWLMVGLAMGIGMGVEIIVLKGDVGRQNTIFKFCLQAWLLLSVVAGISVAWIRERARRWRPRVAYLWWAAMGVLILGGSLFLPLGVYARATDRISPLTGLTLDGMAFVRTSSVCELPPGYECDCRLPPPGGCKVALAGDYYAIQWMQDNIQGSPVIVEGLGWREYLWEGRVSIHTGLPTVVGWGHHQRQQRPMLPGTLVNQRRVDVNALYDTPDVAQAMDILARYGVRYVYVGDYERYNVGELGRPYSPAGLAKFDQMVADGLLQVIYDTYGVKIYEVLKYDYESD
jgi:YYY domain-containing protein